MGYLYKVGRTWYMGFHDRNGRWVRKSTRTQYKEAARKYLEQAERAAADGKPTLPPMPLRDFLLKYLEEQRPALDAGTHVRYGYCLGNLVVAGSPLAGLNLSDVTVALCDQYVSWRLSHKKSKSTVNKEVSWLKSGLRKAARQDLVSWETVARIKDQINPKELPALRKANNSRERVLLPKEITILFQAVETNRNLHDALTVGLWTGLRQENILELVEAQVDFTCDPAVVRFTPAQMKNEEGHLVRLTPRVREVLWSRWGGYPENSGRRFFQDFRPAWKRVQRKLERNGLLRDFHFHDLRRTYTTYRLAAGIDPKTVQDEVGDQTSRMTMDVYGKAVRDPGIRAWAMSNFRFSSDPQPLSQIAHSSLPSPLSGGG